MNHPHHPDHHRHRHHGHGHGHWHRHEHWHRQGRGRRRGFGRGWRGGWPARPWDALLDTFGTEELDALQRDLEQAAADIAERIRRRTAGSATPPPENQPTPSPAA